MSSKKCPSCGACLVHNKGIWRCENSFKKSETHKPACTYQEKDTGDQPEFEEAMLRVESRNNIRGLMAYENVCDLFS